MRDHMKTLHVNISVNLNESDYSWEEPYAEKRIEFNLPLVMFDQKKVGEVIQQMVKDIEAAFPDAVIEHARAKKEQAERESREKVIDEIIEDAKNA